MHAYGFEIAVERSRLRVSLNGRLVHEVPLNGVLPACLTFCKKLSVADFAGAVYDFDFASLLLVLRTQADYALLASNLLISGDSVYVYSERYRGIVCWRPSGQQFVFAPLLGAFAEPRWQHMFFKHRKTSAASPMVGRFQAQLAKVYADLAPFAAKPKVDSCLRELRSLLVFLEDLEDRGFEDTLAALFEAPYEV